jgi:hypothetical protein
MPENTVTITLPSSADAQRAAEILFNVANNGWSAGDAAVLKALLQKPRTKVSLDA